MMLGEILIKKKLITQVQLDAALEEQRETKDFLGGILVRRRFIQEDDLLKALSDQFSMPFISLKTTPIDWDAALSFSGNVVSEHKCLALKRDEDSYTVAITNPLDALAISRIEQAAKGLTVHLVIVRAQEMSEALAVYRERMAAKIKKMFE